MFDELVTFNRALSIHEVLKLESLGELASERKSNHVFLVGSHATCYEQSATKYTVIPSQ